MTPRDIPLYTLDDISRAAGERLALICPASKSFTKPKPAAFYIGLPGHYLLRLIRKGIYVYKKENQTEKGECDE